MAATVTLESQAIRLTIAGNIAMTALGVVFALWTRSEAIFLDSVFSGVHVLISVLSLHVAHLIQQPEDQSYPFGYAMFEPLLNMAKGVIIASVAVFALFSAVAAILDGGRPIAAGIALGYALLAALGCLILAALQQRFAHICQSPILELDAKNWLIDGVISGAVALAFGLMLVLQRTSLTAWIPYADPVLVMALVLFILPLPLQTVHQNWAQIIGRAPEARLQKQIRQGVESVLQTVPYQTYHLRSISLGRLVYVQIYLQMLPTQLAQWSAAEIDDLRNHAYQTLQLQLPHLTMDLIVTADPIWIRRSVQPFKTP